MHLFLSAFLAFAGITEDFPEISEPDLIEDVPVADDAVGPDDDVAGPDDGSKGSSQAPPRREVPAQSPGVPEVSSTDSRPFLAGYKDVLWRDSRKRIQGQYPERPLVEQGDGKWVIQDECEGEKALVIFHFGRNDELNRIVCQFRYGLEDTQPDHPLYAKLRGGLVRLWGEPAVANESPAPDSPTQAVQWQGKVGKASLVFDLSGQFVQLSVEQGAR